MIEATNPAEIRRRMTGSETAGAAPAPNRPREPEEDLVPQDHQYGIRMYVILSSFMALIAIVTTSSSGTIVTPPVASISPPKEENLSPSPFGWSGGQKKKNAPVTLNSLIQSKQDLFSIENLAKAAVLASQKKKRSDNTNSENKEDPSIFEVSAAGERTQSENSSSKNINFQNTMSATSRWLNIMKRTHASFQNNDNKNKKKKNDNSSSSSQNTNNKKKKSNKSKEPLSKPSYFWSNWNIWYLFQSNSSPHRNFSTFSVDTATNMIDKVLTSTPRIVIIANLLLAITYLLHSVVADYFLGPSSTNPQYQNEPDLRVDDDNNNNINNNIDATNIRRMNNNNGNTMAASNRIHRSGRERLGGYLMFKLLLISAVVDPDSLDLLILSSWYTLLSFLRSLSHLCGATIAHTAQTGQPPRSGVFSLLILLSVIDILSAAVCAALFHGAGWNMVLLLTCDCALLAIDILVHLTRYAQQSMEESHSITVFFIEAQQLQIHTQIREHYNHRTTGSTQMDENERDSIRNNIIERLREESSGLDREMEKNELMHGKRLAVLDNFAFASELVSLFLTFAHFVHIWLLHGVTFGLVDGVLALHLHSALSAMGKKILERRKFNRIARDLDLLFEDATELDIQKNNNDVCCICLTSMSTDGNPVKKLSCGHMYHTSCLREVVERARSIEAAKCPLCRASVVSGTHSPLHSQPPTNNNTNTPNQGDNNNNTNTRQGTGAGEHPLFGFSTEGIFPAWIPIPAFSFEIVRRPSATLTTPNIANNNINNNINTNAESMDNNTNVDTPTVTEQNNNTDGNVAAPLPNNDNGNNNNNNNNHPLEENVSLWRRLFVLSGILPMSPQEEAIALDQLVDMFPQYERADLLMELRQRRSTEAVVEAVLMGVFSSGVPRQGALVTESPPRNDFNASASPIANASISEPTNNSNNNNSATVAEITNDFRSNEDNINTSSNQNHS